MVNRIRVLVAMVLVAACSAAANDKEKSTLPQYVLDAQFVFVMIDPDAGAPMNEPMGNKTAQDDVEKELMKWGRLRPVMTMSQADLVIVIRKGTKQAMQPTVSTPPPNDRPVIVQGTDSSIRVGAQQGRNPDAAQNGGPVSQGHGTGGEIAPAEDFFSVYQGRVESPMDRIPVWRYVAKDALKGPDVRAVAEFKKVVDEAVKQQQAQQKQQAQQQTQPQPTKP